MNRQQRRALDARLRKKDLKFLSPYDPHAIYDVRLVQGVEYLVRVVGLGITGSTKLFRRVPPTEALAAVESTDAAAQAFFVIYEDDKVDRIEARYAADFARKLIAMEQAVAVKEGERTTP